MFDLDRFIEDCRAAVREDSSPKAAREVLARANSDPAAIQKPMIGVVSMKGEQTPCNMTHAFQVEENPPLRDRDAAASSDGTAGLGRRVAAEYLARNYGARS